MKDFQMREPKKPKKNKEKGWCTERSIIPNLKAPKSAEDQEKTQKTKKVRCPTCGKRLTPRAVFDVGFDYWEFPAHKQK